MNGFTDPNHITDPTDFKTTSIPKIFEIDSLLRCHICKEFLNAPMLTSCGHTFCSVCIRKCLMHTAKCPICSKEIRESNLSRNVVLEQLVTSYKIIRPDLLKKLVVKQDQQQNIIDKQPEVIDLDDEEDEGKEEEEEDDDDVEEEIIIVEETKKRKNSSSIESMFKRQKKEDRKPNPNTGVCPICSKVYPLEELQTTHIDACLANPQPKSEPPRLEKTIKNSSSSPFSKSFFQPKENINNYKKLTKLDYSSLSTPQLKTKLSKLELPTLGTRHELETRYNEYLILWNANCDSINAKNPKVLRSQLAKWESSIKVKFEGDKKLDKDGWKELIKKARESLKKDPVNTDNEKNDARGEIDCNQHGD
ncbi:hypothetical protein WICMUC_005463 [Wickerhamomyces mucosus]|uniref:Postreplication repair E3 ubiquitin-protein ligase RAD18 n=1 Tax=Wickerhamomyces mucosus TaxID=1378264 RepID=A0A9P8T6P0_9ASCO|nr:hypothetical protein WICMUC_005463 [Wickerhamomyces mucosus]